MSSMKHKPHARFSKSLSIAVILSGFIALPCFIFFAALDWSVVNPEDEKKYHELIADAGAGKEDERPGLSQSKQDRHQVQKDVMYMQGPDRLRLCILADDAQMVVDHLNEESQVIEHMQGVTCYMQEELYYLLPDGREASLQVNGKLLIKKADPQQASSWLAVSKEMKPMQLIRVMEADHASYYYKTDQFVADKVKIARYAISGHDLPKTLKKEKILMKGNAAKVQFFLNGKDLNFQATQLKASIFGNGKML